jgi:medium-chain acyl-[acyl-carrier-protein] hydrolase
MRDAVSRWFIREAPVHAPASRVICFPYAGGSASIYRGWHEGLPSDTELVAVELPGRGAHFNEAPIGSLNELVRRLATAVTPLMDVPVVFFGHSNGALISYALAVELTRRGIPLPCAMILSAKRPPHLESGNATHALPTPQFIDILRALNGTPPEILANEPLLELLLPALRADFSLSETYRHEPCPPLRCRTRLMGSENDPEVSLDQLREWAGYFEQEPALDVMPGDHYFVHTARNEIMKVVRQLLRECNAAASPWRTA